MLPYKVGMSKYAVTREGASVVLCRFVLSCVKMPLMLSMQIILGITQLLDSTCVGNLESSLESAYCNLIYFRSLQVIVNKSLVQNMVNL